MSMEVIIMMAMVMATRVTLKAITMMVLGVNIMKVLGVIMNTEDFWVKVLIILILVDPVSKSSEMNSKLYMKSETKTNVIRTTIATSTASLAVPVLLVTVVPPVVPVTVINIILIVTRGINDRTTRVLPRTR